MGRAFERWILLGLGSIVFLIVLSADVAHRNTSRLHEDSLAVARSLEVLDALSDVDGSIKDAETGYRGFLITGEPRYLEPYQAASAVIGQRCDRLTSLTSNEPEQQARVARLRAGLDRKMKEMDQAIEAFGREGFRITISSIGDAVIVTDMSGRITSLNTIAQTLTGWCEADALGRNLEEVFCIFNEETRASVDNPVTKVLKDGMIVGLANHTILIARGGSERPIDDSAAPIRDAEGEIQGVVLVFRDVTDRRRAEQDLIDAKSYAESIVDTVREPLLVLGSDLRVGSASRSFCRTFGVEPEDVEGRDFFELAEGQWEIPALRKAICKVLPAANPVEDFEVDFVSPAVGRRTLLLSAAPIDHEGRRADQILVTFQDITKRKETEVLLKRQADALKEADTRKDEFLATLAHELRNPLAPIRNSLYIMRLVGDDREAVESSRAVIERQVLHLVRLVDDLLDISRISRNRLELKRELVELAAVIASAVEASRPLAERQGVELSVSPPPESTFLDADPVRLAQVFSNLLNNACKYTERGGHVRLTTAREGGEVSIAVEDDGVGIPAEMLPRIFDMFTQVDRSLERSQGGLGIGLTLVRRLVELHGGSVEAQSDGLGHGSRFIVRLPAAVKEAPKCDLDLGAGDLSGRSGKRRILVVDDNHDSADSLARMLRVLGNEVRTAYDGAEALDLSNTFRPELAFVDIGLPGMNGYDVSRRIREQPWGRDVTLVALTGWGQEEDHRRSTEAGFDHHVVKPADFDALSRILTN